MHVDRTLLRLMLEEVEAAPRPELMFMPEPAGYSREVQRWHTQMLIDGGYVSAQQLRPYARAVAVGLTIAGQRLLDELRSAGSGLAKTAGRIAERAFVSLTIGLLMAKAKALGFELPG